VLLETQSSPRKTVVCTPLLLLQEFAHYPTKLFQHTQILLENLIDRLQVKPPVSMTNTFLKPAKSDRPSLSSKEIRPASEMISNVSRYVFGLLNEYSTIR